MPKFQNRCPICHQTNYVPRVYKWSRRIFSEDRVKFKTSELEDKNDLLKERRV